jgi:hypothetical protein
MAARLAAVRWAALHRLRFVRFLRFGGGERLGGGEALGHQLQQHAVVAKPTGNHRPGRFGRRGCDLVLDDAGQVACGPAA